LIDRTQSDRSRFNRPVKITTPWPCNHSPGHLSATRATCRYVSIVGGDRSAFGVLVRCASAPLRDRLAGGAPLKAPVAGCAGGQGFTLAAGQLDWDRQEGRESCGPGQFG
jgi:hypothetical protein